MRRPLLFLLLVVALLGAGGALWAGGPLIVGGPTFGLEGQPFVWSTSGPVQYRTDGGGLGTMNNAQAVARVQAMFDVWQNVPTAAIAYTRAGPLLAAPPGFPGGDVTTRIHFDAVVGSCGVTQNPIIFDADGSLFTRELGLSSGVIGFATPCRFNTAGRILGGYAALNGKFLITGQLNDNEFDAAFIHEFGHFSGLDHAQINSNCVSRAACQTGDHDGVPTMFPFLAGEFMKSLSADDIAWISRLYPQQPAFGEAFGTVRGYIYFSDGVSQVQGANVIARRLESGVPSRTFAVSVVSGYRFTDNPGQPFTANYLPCATTSLCAGSFLDDNTGGSFLGSRDPALVGFYEMSLPPGTYVIEVQSVYSGFVGGSSVGPLDPPVPLPGVAEYWNEEESATDDPAAFSPIVVQAGEVIEGIHIILNGTPPRFDQFEDSDVTFLFPTQPAWLREEQEGAMA